MSLIAIIISAIAGSIPNILSLAGVKTTVANLIGASITALGALFSAFKSGTTLTSESAVALTALQAEYTAIKNDTSADPAVIGAIAEVSNLVDDALLGWTNAQTVDPGTLDTPPAVQ